MPPPANEQRRESEKWQEALASAMEHMVSQMDVITQSLQSMESRIARTEEAVADLTDLASRRAGIASS